MDRLNLAIAGAKRSGNTLAVLFIDLDKFKEINDTFGHHIGDRMLVKYANTLGKCVRNSDTVARLAGDEFVILLNKIHEPNDAALVAEKVTAISHNQIQVKKHMVTIDCSIGISIFPQDGDDANTLVNNADIAMYRAKNDGRQGYRFYQVCEEDPASLGRKSQHALDSNLKQKYRFSFKWQLNQEGQGENTRSIIKERREDTA